MDIEVKDQNRLGTCNRKNNNVTKTEFNKNWKSVIKTVTSECTTKTEYKKKPKSQNYLDKYRSETKKKILRLTTEDEKKIRGKGKLKNQIFA